MEKTIIFACILLLSTCTTPAFSKYYRESEAYKPVLKKTQLRFFIHDILSGSKPSAVRIAAPNTTAYDTGNPTPFGTVYAIDDVLTEGPEATSAVVGNAQGMYLSSSQGKNLTLVMYVDLGFTAGRFKGSSLSVFSRNPVTESHREMAVVGGRGRFRRAQGTVFVKTHFLNYTNGDAVLQYDVEVVHP
ncbi:dirigent protein 4-like [Salvia miltiorrhiza]|uniref:dirigent protein 4-like n=1 Tax=Salvia miltiorrhiza TaxID=226208 RepID=UPI0025AB8CD8|nr:dirigent protein 4-like [Salvia miltiorrhiza]